MIDDHNIIRLLPKYGREANQLAEQITALLNRWLSGREEADKGIAILATLMVVGDLIGSIECHSCAEIAEHKSVELLSKIIEEAKWGLGEAR